MIPLPKCQRTKSEETLDPIMRNPGDLKETLMLGFIAKARFWQPQSVSCPLPLLLICPNKRSLLDAG